jgi:hypothetical protein
MLRRVPVAGFHRGVMAPALSNKRMHATGDTAALIFG